MDKELCFKIENDSLYLEQVLVDYMGIPIFFLCKSKQQYFIALCTDIEELNYIVTKLSLDYVYKLLRGQISMRDVILRQEEYWNIISGDEISQDKVKKEDISSLDEGILPEEGAYFKLLTKEIERFVNNFENSFFANENYSKIEKKLSLSEGATELPDLLIKEINVYNELLDYKIEKPLFSPNNSLYNEKMNSIKTKEVNIDKLKCESQQNGFKLMIPCINNMADAA